MSNLKYDTNEHIYETDTDPQMQGTDLWLSGGGELGGGVIGSVGLTDANCYI